MTSLRHIPSHATLSGARIHVIAFTVVALVWATAATATPPPTDALDAAHAALAAADTPDGGRYASEQLVAARRQLAAAQVAMGKHDYKIARELADEAQADADLARARTAALVMRATINAKTRENAELQQRLLGQGPQQWQPVLPQTGQPPPQQFQSLPPAGQPAPQQFEPVPPAQPMQQAPPQFEQMPSAVTVPLQPPPQQFQSLPPVGQPAPQQFEPTPPAQPMQQAPPQFEQMLPAVTVPPQPQHFLPLPPAGPIPSPPPHTAVNMQPPTPSPQNQQDVQPALGSPDGSVQSSTPARTPLVQAQEHQSAQQEQVVQPQSTLSEPAADQGPVQGPLK